MKMSSSIRTSLVVVQPTQFCNIDCSYCYLPHRSQKTRLSHEKLRIIFANLSTFPTVSGALSIVWHAGEPLTLPPAYYEEAFRVISEVLPSGFSINHSIQTNGTLIDDAWCAFFSRHKVNVGVSLDGPKEFHDSYRRYRSGAGSFDRVIGGIQLLQKNSVPFYVITVLTDKSIQRPDDLFEFYKLHRITNIAFNIEEEEKVGRVSSLRKIDFAEAFKKFLRRFWQRSSSGTDVFMIREIERSLLSIRGQGGNVLDNEQTTPFTILSIDVEGNVATFSPELLGADIEAIGRFTFGNLLVDSYENIVTSKKFQEAWRQIDAGVEKCSQCCEYFSVCGGGAPSNKYYENGSFDSTETMYCKLMQQVPIDVALEVIETYRGLHREEFRDELFR